MLNYFTLGSIQWYFTRCGTIAFMHSLVSRRGVLGQEKPVSVFSRFLTYPRLLILFWFLYNGHDRYTNYFRLTWTTTWSRRNRNGNVAGSRSENRKRMRNLMMERTDRSRKKESGKKRQKAEKSEFYAMWPLVNTVRAQIRNAYRFRMVDACELHSRFSPIHTFTQP